MQTFLSENFGKVHDEVKSEPKGILRSIANFFRSFAAYFGYKKESQAIVERTIGEIEKVHSEALKDKYLEDKTLDQAENGEEELHQYEGDVEKSGEQDSYSEKFKPMEARSKELKGHQPKLSAKHQEKIDQFKLFKVVAQRTIRGDDVASRTHKDDHCCYYPI